MCAMWPYLAVLLYHDAALRWQLSDIPLSSHLGFGLAIAMMTLHHGWHASK